MSRRTSEQVRGLPDQPGPLCYHIDFNLVVNLQAGDADGAMRSAETLRAEIVKLRAWGQAWKDYAKGLDRSASVAIGKEPQSNE